MKTVLAILLYCTIVHVAMASDVIIWQKELSCDPNSACRPGTLMVDEVSNEVIILGTSERLQKREANWKMWKIDLNGNIVNKKTLGSLSTCDLRMVGPFGIKATVKPNTGDIINLKQDNIDSISFSVTNRNMQTQTAKLGIRRKKTETFKLHDMVSLKGNKLLFVGQDRGEDGIVISTDLDGNVIWKEIFDNERTELLSDIARGPEEKNYYVVGLSASTSSKMMFDGPATVCLLCYDDSGRLKASDFFEGGLSPWPSSLPKAVYLPSGVVVVVYDKSKNGLATKLHVKAYTPELKPLYEKQILKTKEEGPPAPFDICATPEDRFVLVVQVNYWDLRIYEYDVDGTILQTVELDGEVGAGGVYVDYLAGKIFVAFATKSQGKEAKIKLIALKPYQTN